MNHYRGRYAHDESSTADIDSQPESAITDDEQLNFDNAELVHYGLSRLRLPEREILTLYFLDDLAVAEIAAVLEIPSGTVKSRLSKARGALRRILDEEAARHER
jgi:RNA polymerase sigma factor (sigma-70 family)